MGNSTSKSSPTPGYGNYGWCNDEAYSVGIIDDQSINQIIRDKKEHLSCGDKQLLRDAQWRATSELSRTMRNCELYIYLDGFNVVLKSGDCTNKVIVRRNGKGEIEWKYVRRSKTQYLYDTGKSVIGFLGRAGSFFATTASSLIGPVAKAAIGWHS